MRYSEMKEAVRTSETLVYFNETTRHYTPQGCNLNEKVLEEFSLSLFSIVKIGLQQFS
jgi:hypothetical protein